MEKNQQDLVQQIMKLAGTQGLSPDQINDLMSKLSVQNTSSNTGNPEEEKQSASKSEGQIKELIKGMRQLENKNIILNLQSQKCSWEDLKVPDPIKHVLEELKMNRPSIIQAHAIPRVNDQCQDNFLFQASNGSGKTLAFGIPSIMRVDPSIEGVQVLIIANTRELIRQVQQVISKVCSNTKVTCCIGDTNTATSAANIVVTVPKWIDNRLTGRKPIDLSNLKLVIYDEADEIFQQEGNHDSIRQLLTHIGNKAIQAQQVLFSATFDPNTMDKINRFFTMLKIFTVSKEALKLKGVKQFRLTVPEKQKQDFIMKVYTEMDVYQTMIFVNKKEDAIRLQEKLNKQGIKAEKLIGGIDQSERDTIIDNFRRNTITSLICTNVLARGIDVPEVDLVINYDVPYISEFGFKNPDYANYIHRVGRTGRFGTDGVALTLVTAEDEVYDDLVDSIQDYYNITIEKLEGIDGLKEILTSMRGNLLD